MLVVAVEINVELPERKIQEVMTLNEDKKTFTADTESGLDPTVETSIVAKLKRGRKITEEEKYKEDSRKKIIELRIELKNKNLNAEQRQKIRNKISA